MGVAPASKWSPGRGQGCPSEAVLEGRTEGLQRGRGRGGGSQTAAGVGRGCEVEVTSH